MNQCSAIMKNGNQCDRRAIWHPVVNGEPVESISLCYVHRKEFEDGILVLRPEFGIDKFRANDKRIIELLMWQFSRNILKSHDDFRGGSRRPSTFVDIWNASLSPLPVKNEG